MYGSGREVALGILVAYLNAAGAERWRQNVFSAVWRDFSSLLDPSDETVDYVAYAPIVGGLSGIQRRIKFDRDLSIERLSPARVAALGTHDPHHLAGVTFRHRLTLWPMTFLVRRISLRKVVTESEAHPTFGDPTSAELVSEINEEAALLRALLDRKITIPSVGVLPAGALRSPGHSASQMLPWRPRARSRYLTSTSCSSQRRGLTVRCWGGALFGWGARGRRLTSK